jgi:hypothetical protein
MALTILPFKIRRNTILWFFAVVKARNPGQPCEKKKQELPLQDVAIRIAFLAFSAKEISLMPATGSFYRTCEKYH